MVSAAHEVLGETAAGGAGDASARDETIVDQQRRRSAASALIRM